MPILLLLLFGIIDFGRALNTQITLTQGAREGARAAVLVPVDPSINVAQRVNAATTAIAPDSTVIEASCPGNEQAVVRVDKTFVFITPVGAIASLFGSTGPGGSIQMSGRGVMTCR